MNKYSIKLLKFWLIIVTIVPLIINPNDIYRNDLKGFRFNKLTIITAVHAPVTGNGRPTKRVNPK